MLECFDFIRQLSFPGVAIRLCVAVICGGLIGIEREYKRRPAGFRTHILICLGATMTTLTSQYLFLSMQLYTDIARLGAQVVAGIGFIGAGSIIVTKQKRVKGLTTAAGLWTAAIIGLVCGAGYVECALFGTFMVLFSELLLVKLEYRFAHRVTDFNLYVEYGDPMCIEAILQQIKKSNGKITGMEISRVTGSSENEHYYCAVLTVQAVKQSAQEALGKSVGLIPGVRMVEEI